MPSDGIWKKFIKRICIEAGAFNWMSAVIKKIIAALDAKIHNGFRPVIPLHKNRVYR